LVFVEGSSSEEEEEVPDCERANQRHVGDWERRCVYFFRVEGKDTGKTGEKGFLGLNGNMISSAVRCDLFFARYTYLLLSLLLLGLLLDNLLLSIRVLLDTFAMLNSGRDLDHLISRDSCDRGHIGITSGLDNRRLGGRSGFGLSVGDDRCRVERGGFGGVKCVCSRSFSDGGSDGECVVL
jgi:hypothetical protein